jgi:hypothetical protein
LQNEPEQKDATFGRCIEQEHRAGIGISGREKEKPSEVRIYLSHRRASVVYLGLADLHVFEMCFIL